MSITNDKEGTNTTSRPLPDVEADIEQVDLQICGSKKYRGLFILAGVFHGKLLGLGETSVGKSPESTGNPILSPPKEIASLLIRDS